MKFGVFDFVPILDWSKGIQKESFVPNFKSLYFSKDAFGKNYEKVWRVCLNFALKKRLEFFVLDYFDKTELDERIRSFVAREGFIWGNTAFVMGKLTQESCKQILNNLSGPVWGVNHLKVFGKNSPITISWYDNPEFHINNLNLDEFNELNKIIEQLKLEM